MATNSTSAAPEPRVKRGQLLLLLLLLGGALAVLCHEAFLPNEVSWANDSALGAMKESSARLPGTFTGFWGDFWWIGGATPSSSPSLSTLFATVVSPEHYLKTYAPLTMLFFGFCAWFFFRQLRFSALASVISAVGAGLNMHFFSNGCWGLGTWTVSCGMVFVALGILASPYIRQLWIKGVLAGLAVGLVVMEGFDVGAILSVYIGIFLAFLFLFASGESDPIAGIVKTLGVGTLVVVCAFAIAASTLYTLVGTQISGTAGIGQTDADKEAHWEFTVQWSIPKLESLRVVIPGLFGYRLRDYTTSTNHGSYYWGKVAEDPRIEQWESRDPKTRVAAATAFGVPQQVRDIEAGDDMRERDSILDQIKASGVQLRHTGNGEYAGVLLCLLAVFGLASACRGEGCPYSVSERRIVWFWGGAALFSLLCAWGHHGFLYRFVYPLPYFANIRSPMKFMHPLNICLIILCGFGLEALYRGYLEPAGNAAESLRNRLLHAWKKSSRFDKFWTLGTLVFFILSVVAFYMYSDSKPGLITFLERNGFDSTDSPQIAAFSVREVALYLVYFGLSAWTIICILSGAWAGKRMIWAWVFLSAIMICDLCRADAPWVRYFDYEQKYSMNPVVDILRKEPWEHRVVSRFSPMGGYDMGQDSTFAQLCHWWLENDYPYNDIQSLEIDQAPRMPVLDSSYLGNFMVHSAADLSPAAIQWLATTPRDNPAWNWVVQAGPAARLWRLTNTRYIFATAQLTDLFNQYLEPPNSFRAVMRMKLALKPGVDVPEDSGDLAVQTNSDGGMALIEFTRALPRTKLYANWTALDDSSTLKTLASREFDPETTVIVAKDTPVAQKPGSPQADPGTVKITQYKAKDLILQANAKTPAIALLNDRTGDGWSVTVDQKPAQLLRCNYIMRGVFVPPGEHTIEFRFRAPLQYLYISVTAFAIGVLLGGYVIFAHFGEEGEQSVKPAEKKNRPASKAA
jgi:hypothetical protein